MTSSLRIFALSALALLFLTHTAAAEPPRASTSFFIEASTLYISPDAPPLREAVVVVQDGRITAAGARASMEIPHGIRRSPCSGGVVTAGFQNSHRCAGWS